MLFTEEDAVGGGSFDGVVAKAGSGIDGVESGNSCAEESVNAGGMSMED